MDTIIITTNTTAPKTPPPTIPNKCPDKPEKLKRAVKYFC